MARVSIEERAAVGAKRIARELNCEFPKAIGFLYLLWHDSQEIEKTECTQDDICIWLNLIDGSDVTKALVNADFLVDNKDGTYLIVGNSKHIENLRFKREKAKENGKLGGRPKKPTQKPTLVSTQNQHENHSSLQFSALQCSSLQKENTILSTDVDHRLAKIWNEHRGTLPECKTLNSKRKRRLEAAWREKPDPDYWSTLIKNLATSAFHTGRNDRGWVATVDFLLQPGKHTELSERFSAGAPSGGINWEKLKQELAPDEV